MLRIALVKIFLSIRNGSEDELSDWHTISLIKFTLQASKACVGVFCILITEARETTALEMPDHDNTFVLKA